VGGIHVRHLAADDFADAADVHAISIGIDAFRLDALNHIDSNTFIDWISELETHGAPKLINVSEYWS
jgi:glycosidase